MGDTTKITSRSELRNTSAFVGEWTPPSKYSTPPIATGAKYAGIAHEASTAEARVAFGDPSRPRTTLAPSSRRATQIHRPSGHQDPTKASSRAARSVIST